MLKKSFARYFLPLLVGAMCWLVAATALAQNAPLVHQKRLYLDSKCVANTCIPADMQTDLVAYINEFDAHGIWLNIMFLSEECDSLTSVTISGQGYLKGPEVQLTNSAEMSNLWMHWQSNVQKAYTIFVRPGQLLVYRSKAALSAGNLSGPIPDNLPFGKTYYCFIKIVLDKIASVNGFSPPSGIAGCNENIAGHVPVFSYFDKKKFSLLQEELLRLKRWYCTDLAILDPYYLSKSTKITKEQLEEQARLQMNSNDYVLFNLLSPKPGGNGYQYEYLDVVTRKATGVGPNACYPITRNLSENDEDKMEAAAEQFGIVSPSTVGNARELLRELVTARQIPIPALTQCSYDNYVASAPSGSSNVQGSGHFIHNPKYKITGIPLAIPKSETKGSGEVIYYNNFASQLQDFFVAGERAKKNGLWIKWIIASGNRNDHAEGSRVFYESKGFFDNTAAIKDTVVAWLYYDLEKSNYEFDVKLGSKFADTEAQIKIPADSLAYFKKEVTERMRESMKSSFGTTLTDALPTVDASLFSNFLDSICPPQQNCPPNLAEEAPWAWRMRKQGVKAPEIFSEVLGIAYHVIRKQEFPRGMWHPAPGTIEQDGPQLFDVPGGILGFMDAALSKIPGQVTGILGTLDMVQSLFTDAEARKGFVQLLQKPHMLIVGNYVNDVCTMADACYKEEKYHATSRLIGNLVFDFLGGQALGSMAKNLDGMANAALKKVDFLPNSVTDRFNSLCRAPTFPRGSFNRFISELKEGSRAMFAQSGTTLLKTWLGIKDEKPGLKDVNPAQYAEFIDHLPNEMIPDPNNPLGSQTAYSKAMQDAFEDADGNIKSVEMKGFVDDFKPDADFRLLLTHKPELMKGYPMLASNALLRKELECLEAGARIKNLKDQNLLPDIGQITNAQLSLIQRYTHNGDFLNSPMRAGGEVVVNPINLAPKELAAYQEVVGGMEKLRQTGRLVIGVRVYRGRAYTKSDFDALFKSANPEVPLKGFVSTSRNEEVAKYFLTKSGGHIEDGQRVYVMMKIDSKKGVDVDDMSSYGKNLCPQNPGCDIVQEEVLMEEGKFKRLSPPKYVRTDEKGNKYYEVELEEMGIPIR